MTDARPADWAKIWMDAAISPIFVLLGQYFARLTDPSSQESAAIETSISMSQTKDNPSSGATQGMKCRQHRGDIMSPEKRSAVMAKIKGKNTGPEKAVAAAMAALELEWESHTRDLPGHPDFVFRDAKVAVFVDGDFWHGWRFKEWRNKLSEKWEAKISATRQRDARNRKTLRASGWIVVRVWSTK